TGSTHRVWPSRRNVTTPPSSLGTCTCCCITVEPHLKDTNDLISSNSFFKTRSRSERTSCPDQQLLDQALRLPQSSCVLFGQRPELNFPPLQVGEAPAQRPEESS